MAIDFSVEPEFQEQLDWIRDLVHSEIEPLDLALPRRVACSPRSTCRVRRVARALARVRALRTTCPSRLAVGPGVPHGSDRMVTTAREPRNRLG